MAGSVAGWPKSWVDPDQVGAYIHYLSTTMFVFLFRQSESFQTLKANKHFAVDNIASLDLARIMNRDVIIT